MRPRLLVAAGILRRGTEVLVARRNGGEWDGYWEFPGGKVEAGESVFTAIRRELQEELTIDVKPIALVGLGLERRRQRVIVLAAVEVSCAMPSAGLDAQHRWVSFDQLDPATMPAADRPILATLRGSLRPRYAESTDVDEATIRLASGEIVRRSPRRLRHRCWGQAIVFENT